MSDAKLSSKDIAELKELGRVARGNILIMTTVGNSGHPGGSMSSIDIYLTIYRLANVDPKNPLAEDRDRIIVSHGHTSPGRYSALGAYGFIDIKEAITGFRHAGSIFEGHVTRGIPGIEWTTGNLGQGLSIGVGMALGARFSGLNYKVFVAMSDAEQAKGQVAEARRTAVKYGLNNLVVVLDDNNAQISGKAENVMKVNIKEDYLADGWKVIEVDGHNFDELTSAVIEAKEYGDGPVVVIGKTVMGKGVSFMENDVSYHGKPLDPVTCARALAELGEKDDLEYYFAQRELLPETHIPLKPQNIYVELDTGTPRTYPVEKKNDNRSAFGNALADMAKLNKGKNPMAVVDCDLKPSTKVEEFEKVWPENFVQIGVQEHNAAALAGAMSVCGVTTFFADFGVFGIDETFNQQRLNDINKANLKVGVTHVGTDVGEDGKTHHCLDYISSVRNFYGYKLIVPADPNQTDRAVRYMADYKGNVVIAMGRSKINTITDENGNPYFAGDYVFEYGKVDVLRKG